VATPFETKWSRGDQKVREKSRVVELDGDVFVRIVNNVSRETHSCSVSILGHRKHDRKQGFVQSKSFNTLLPYIEGN